VVNRPMTAARIPAAMRGIRRMQTRPEVRAELVDLGAHEVAPKCPHMPNRICRSGHCVVAYLCGDLDAVWAADAINSAFSSSGEPAEYVRCCSVY
jgi:hypothetical protein